MNDIHGQCRNHRKETRTEYQNYIIQGNRETTLPSFSITESVNEIHCGTCAQWFEVRGIMGHLMGCPKCGRSWYPNGKD